MLEQSSDCGQVVARCVEKGARLEGRMGKGAGNWVEVSRTREELIACDGISCFFSKFVLTATFPLVLILVAGCNHSYKLNMKALNLFTRD